MFIAYTIILSLCLHNFVEGTDVLLCVNHTPSNSTESRLRKVFEAAQARQHLYIHWTHLVRSASMSCLPPRSEPL